jgi:hypothetical protein
MTMILVTGALMFNGERMFAVGGEDFLSVLQEQMKEQFVASGDEPLLRFFGGNPFSPIEVFSGLEGSQEYEKVSQQFPGSTVQINLEKEESDG